MVVRNGKSTEQDEGSSPAASEQVAGVHRYAERKAIMQHEDVQLSAMYSSK